MKIHGALAIAAVGLLTVSAAACGDDDDGGSSATTGGASATTAGGASATTTGGSSSGGDASSATEADYLAAIESQFTQGGTDSLQMTDEQAGCVAPKWLDVIGVDKLKEKGITPEDVKSDTDNEQLATVGLTEAEGDKLYDAYGECDVDVREQFIKSIASSTEASEDCLADALSEDLLRRIFVTSVTKGQAGLDADEELTNDIFSALGKCAPTTTTT
jgi:hypothetical protein